MVREISIQSKVAEEVIDNREEMVIRVFVGHESFHCEPCLVTQYLGDGHATCDQGDIYSVE